MINTFIQFHNEVFFGLYNLAQNSETLQFWVYIIAERLDWYVILAAIFFVLLHQHKRRDTKSEFVSHRSLVEGIVASIGIVGAWGISYLLKITFALPRPFLRFPEITPLFLHGGFNSFPSGHATLFAALAVAMYLNHKKTGIFFILAAFLIGIARVIAGVHFPIDILAGWLLGTLVSVLVHHTLIKRMKH